ncbi:glycosyltransferase family 9 protein [Falsiroseomonas sp. CW058]|uniref:glycosyltransferase family 9 protein n=1 Tax=Falsiroseomonas sp. CW058 TaxID=3388664 RepID=UPI003D321462
MSAAEDPGAAWMRHMRRGAWEEAWRIGDAALARPRDWTLPRHLQAVWDGSPVAGRRVLVRCYHGLGDTIQFIRFVPALRAMAVEVATWAQPALIPLLRTMPGIGPLLPLHDGAPDGGHDLDVEVMELAHLLRVTPAALPACVPYFHPPRRALPPGALHVGLVWQAGDWDPSRTVPPALLAPLADIPGVALHILQRGPALADWPAEAGTVDGSDDVLEAASLVAALDLVVSVDSMPAHLAGALGRPVWTLLRHDADWRWMEGRDDSPWYPTMRLFRQARPGDWAGVAARVAAALSRLAARVPGGAPAR